MVRISILGIVACLLVGCQYNAAEQTEFDEEYYQVWARNCCEHGWGLRTPEGVGYYKWDEKGNLYIDKFPKEMLYAVEQSGSMP